MAAARRVGQAGQARLAVAQPQSNSIADLAARTNVRYSPVKPAPGVRYALQRLVCIRLLTESQKSQHVELWSAMQVALCHNPAWSRHKLVVVCTERMLCTERTQTSV